MDIQGRVRALLRDVERTCENAGRDPYSVKIVAATKTVDIENIIAAIDAGINIIGENRVQEAKDKFPHMPETVDKHMIGHLQSNKVKDALTLFNVIHSVDTLKLMEFLNRKASILGKKQDILIQVNVSEEETKHGFRYENLSHVLEVAGAMDSLLVRGFMTIAPINGNPRAVFKALSELLYDMKNENFGKSVKLTELSMGMSNDYRIAIEEGSTYIRIGRSIFGERV